MKHIEMTSKDGLVIKVSDDTTYEDLKIYCDNVDQVNDLVVKLVAELLKGE